MKLEVPAGIEPALTDLQSNRGAGHVTRGAHLSQGDATASENILDVVRRPIPWPSVAQYVARDCGTIMPRISAAVLGAITGLTFVLAWGWGA